MEHSKGHKPLPSNSAGGEFQISTFSTGKVFWFRLVLLPLRKQGALSLGEASDVALEKPESM